MPAEPVTTCSVNPNSTNRRLPNEYETRRCHPTARLQSSRRIVSLSTIGGDTDTLFSAVPRFHQIKQKIRREESEISSWTKYFIVGFNIVFWIFGLLITVVGIYAWIGRDTFNNFGQLAMNGKLLLDPALLFLLTGLMILFISFAGCVGSLRENTCLLLFFSFAIAIIFFSQLAFSTLAFIYRDRVKAESEKQLVLLLQTYRDDPDLKAMIDWVQHYWLHCCGIYSYRNWEATLNFNCSSKTSRGSDICGVPNSCCRDEYFRSNKQCAYGTLEPLAKTHMIHTEGCLPKASRWFETYILPVVIVIVMCVVLQVLTICSAQNLRNDILVQQAKWTWHARPRTYHHRY